MVHPVLGISVSPAQGMLGRQHLVCLGRLDSRRDLLEVAPPQEVLAHLVNITHKYLSIYIYTYIHKSRYRCRYGCRYRYRYIYIYVKPPWFIKSNYDFTMVLQFITKKYLNCIKITKEKYFEKPSSQRLRML